MHVVWIHERGSFAGGAERYLGDTARGLRSRVTRQTLLYDPCLPSSPMFFAPFDAAFPIVDLATQLVALRADVIFAHRVPPAAEPALAAANAPVVRMFHDHQLFCLREHKIGLVDGRVCTQPAGLGCYPCGGFLRRSGGKLKLVGLGGLRRRQRDAFGADLFVVGSQYLAREAAANGVPAERIARLPLYTAARPPRSSLGTGLVFAGQLVRGKGVDVLIEAAAEANVSTTIIGDGPERAKLEALARLRQAPVVFVGTLSPDEVSVHMARARAVVVPSRVPETFGLVGIEAMSVGTPVIASSIGGIPEWLTHDVTGLAVPPDDPVALADAIRAIVSDDALAMRLGDAARGHHLASFTPERHVIGLHAHFQRLVDGACS